MSPIARSASGRRGNGSATFLQASASAESTEAHRRALRILIADDDHDTVQTLCVLLTGEGHDVYGVHDGPSVVPLVRKLRPDAVILDIGMPGMNGYDLARALKEEHGVQCPTLIAVSAYGRQSDKLIGKAAGFDHYFGKPVAIGDLLAALPKKR